MITIIGTWVAIVGQAIASAAPAPPVSTGEATPLVVRADPTPDPVAVAFARVAADLVVLAKAQSDVAALSQAQARLKSAQSAIVESKAALVAAIDAASSNVPVVPVVPKVISLVVISSDNCAPCKTLAPILEKLVLEGIPIEVTKDAADATKWKATVTPSLIMLVDGKEVSRSSGSLTEGQLRTWFNETCIWSKKK